MTRFNTNSLISLGEGDLWAEMQKRMKKSVEKDTISFHLPLKLSEQFDNWIDRHMIIRERLWKMIIEDLMAGALYDIPERYKPKINIHFKDEEENIIKTVEIDLRKGMGPGRPDPKLEGEDETEREDT